MPELPEVETVRSELARDLVESPEGQILVSKVVIRNDRLRWPVPRELAQVLPGTFLREVQRRSKYLLFCYDSGTMIVHLGMSGSLRLLREDEPPRTHDHLDILFADGRYLRYHDPRRFGSFHWTTSDPLQHKLLRHLGPEPLQDGFNGRYLKAALRGRRAAIKQLLLDARIVAGVGNIYANEALFSSGIHPLRSGTKISLARCERLAAAIKAVLAKSIADGGTTLRDYVSSSGRAGEFRRRLQVYDGHGKPCPACGSKINRVITNGRSTFYCPACQR